MWFLRVQRGDLAAAPPNPRMQPTGRRGRDAPLGHSAPRARCGTTGSTPKLNLAGRVLDNPGAYYAKGEHVTLSRSDTRELASAVKEAFTDILGRLEAAQEAAGEGSRLFPSGVELISLTLKAGPNIEFSVRVAGKDAPKSEVAHHPDPSLDPRSAAHGTRADGVE
jgi:hypothetical protein